MWRVVTLINFGNFLSTTVTSKHWRNDRWPNRRLGNWLRRSQDRSYDHCDSIHWRLALNWLWNERGTFEFRKVLLWPGCWDGIAYCSGKFNSWAQLSEGNSPQILGCLDCKTADFCQNRFRKALSAGARFVREARREPSSNYSFSHSLQTFVWPLVYTF